MSRRLNFRLMIAGSAIALGAVLAIAVASPTPASAAEGDVTGFTIAGRVDARAVALGPDGAIWVVGGLSSTDGWVARLSPGDGTVLSDWTLPHGSAPRAIVEGPDGRMWIANAHAAMITAVTPAGVVTQYAAPGAGNDAIIAGPDGNLWFLTSAGVVRMSTTGVVQGTPQPVTYTAASDLATDGEYVYVNDSVNSLIGTMTPGGVSPLWRAIPVAPVNGLAIGSDGAVWFDALSHGSVGELEDNGVSIIWTTPYGSPNYIAFDAAGNRWVSYQNTPHVTETTPGGTTVDYDLSSAGASSSWRLAITPDAVWTVPLSTTSATVVRIEPVVAPAFAADAPSATVGSAYSFTTAAAGRAAYALASGSLPDGLVLDPVTGVISGTPTTRGSATFTVSAANVLGTASRSFTIVVSAVPIADPAAPVEPTLAATGAGDVTTVGIGGIALLGLGCLLLVIRRRLRSR